MSFCKCAAITTNLEVEAYIAGNTIDQNDNGIEIIDNTTQVLQNNIQRSHENGIKISGDRKSRPIIWKNLIESCSYNGIVCHGEHCNPDIRGNKIRLNRRSGIKVTEFANAEIRGITKKIESMFT